MPALPHNCDIRLHTSWSERAARVKRAIEFPTELPAIHAGPLAGGGFIQWAHVDGNLQRPLNVARQDDAQRADLQRRGQYRPVCRERPRACNDQNCILPLEFRFYVWLRATWCCRSTCLLAAPSGALRVRMCHKRVAS